MKSTKAEIRRWRPYVEMFVKARELGLRLSGLPIPDDETRAVGRLPVEESNNGLGLKVVICAPHPDDETLCGGLALRLKQEQGAEVTCLALTLGSKQSRKMERLAELKAACRLLGFKWQLAANPLGLDNITPAARRQPEWREKVKITALNLTALDPDVVIMPHARDRHPTHEGCHHLVMDALMSNRRRRRIIMVETEFWQPMITPNLLVGLSDDDLALMLAALTEHRGEIKRSPYHLTQAPRLMNNVRRGREMPGMEIKELDFLFGELYRMSFLEINGEIKSAAARVW
ncbi:MAG TPA: PIG-L family deacetylase [Desulfobacterales bacterium]|nr:PIG-L family deacetylase [Desulfobacterales bacterium]